MHIRFTCKHSINQQKNMWISTFEKNEFLRISGLQCIYLTKLECRPFFFLMGFIPCKAEQPLRSMEFQGKEVQKDYSIQEICLERTYS